MPRREASPAGSRSPRRALPAPLPGLAFTVRAFATVVPGGPEEVHANDALASPFVSFASPRQERLAVDFSACGVYTSATP